MIKFKDIRKLFNTGEYIIFTTVKGIKKVPAFYVIGEKYAENALGDFTEKELNELEVISINSGYADSGYGGTFSPDYYSYIGICLNV